MKELNIENILQYIIQLNLVGELNLHGNTDRRPNKNTSIFHSPDQLGGFKGIQICAYYLQFEKSVK